MLLHKNHKFIFDNRAAIQLPDSIYFDCNPDVYPMEGFVLHSEDLSIQIDINFVKTDKDAWTYLLEIKDTFEYLEYLEPIRAIVLNGMPGFVLSYALCKETFEEYALSIPGDEPTLLNICFVQKKDQPADATEYARLRDEIIAGLSLVE